MGAAATLAEPVAFTVCVCVFTDWTALGEGGTGVGVGVTPGGRTAGCVAVGVFCGDEGVDWGVPVPKGLTGLVEVGVVL